MALVEVVTEAGLRDYSSAQAQVASAGNHHALVIPITAESQPLLPLVELGRSIRTVGDMVVYGPNVTKL
jgi:hypothetical protein